VPLNRRHFLALSSASILAASLNPAMAESPASESLWQGRWIFYPGQLAAWRHLRRMKLATTRCTGIGYPANYRQPISVAWFRCKGSVAEETPIRWAAPIGRIRLTHGGRSGDITKRSATMRAGEEGIEVQIDFAQSLPAILVDAGPLSSGAQWEASLDGDHWIQAEVADSAYPTDPAILPDSPREIVQPISVHRIVAGADAVAESYQLTAGHELILDFAETELGCLAFTLAGSGKLTAQVGESLPEVRDPDTRYFEQIPLEAISATAEAKSWSLPERALRYVRFSATNDCEISQIRFNASMWPLTEQGSFQSSDVGLNAIWQAAVKTMRSNCHDFYLDGIRRDGLLWHDGTLVLEACERVFASAELSRQTLIGETLPAKPRLRDVGIIDAPMYCVIAFEREWMLRGEPGFSCLFRDRIEEILGFYESLQDARGFVNAAQVEPYGFFPDWSGSDGHGPDGHGTPAYGQMLLEAAFRAGSRLAAAWQDEKLSAHYLVKADQLRASIRTHFYRPATGLYINGLTKSGEVDERITPFAQAYAIAYGLAPVAEHAPLLVALDDPARTHFSLSQVVELSAYARAGHVSAAIERLKKAWLPMLRMGYNRFFEDVETSKSEADQLAMYGRKYAASLCHIWAGAAPVMLLSRGILGIEPLEPGYKRTRIAPKLAGLEWVKGSVPTPHGSIELALEGGKADLTLPAGITAETSSGEHFTGPGSFRFRVG